MALFGSQPNPAKAAMPYLNQVPGVAHQYYDPYVSAGQNASARTQNEYEGLVTDPAAFFNKVMTSYEPSSGYQYEKKELTDALANSARAGGVVGTPLDQQRQAEAVQGLLSKDMQQYLSNVLGLYKTGLEGEEGEATRGFTASSSLADVLSSLLNEKAGLSFQGQAQTNLNHQNLMSALAKILATGTGAAIGGLTTGPAGAAAGAKIGSGVFGGGKT